LHSATPLPNAAFFRTNPQPRVAVPHFIQFSMIASGNKVPLALGRGRVRAYSRLIPEFHWHGWKSIKCCHFAVRVTAGEKKCIAFLQRHGFKFDPKYVSDGACNRAAPPQATHRIRPAQCFKVGRGSVVVLIVTHPSRGRLSNSARFAGFTILRYQIRIFTTSFCQSFWSCEKRVYGVEVTGDHGDHARLRRLEDQASRLLLVNNTGRLNSSRIAEDLKGSTRPVTARTNWKRTAVSHCRQSGKRLCSSSAASCIRRCDLCSTR